MPRQREIARSLKSLARSGVSRLLRPVGFDLIRLQRLPRETYLGLGQLPIRTVIDVGANRGQFAREILRVFPRARLFCFEPVPGVFHVLQAWASRSSGQVSAFNVALGDTEGSVKMSVHVNWDYSSSLLKTTDLALQIYPYQEVQAPIDVRLTCLDEFVKQSGIELLPDILIKVDAQGYDDRVIRGGVETFRKARVCIVEINLDYLYEGQGSFRDIFLLLDSLGYQYAGNLNQEYSPEGRVVFIDAVFIRPADGGGGA